jgi:signal transduction histidine kinase
MNTKPKQWRGKDTRETDAVIAQLIQSLPKQDRRLRQFVNVLRDELVGPLTVIKANLYLAQQTPSRDQQANYLEQINEQTDRLQHLLGHLRVLLQADELEDSEMQHESVDMEVLLRSLIEQLQPVARSRHIRLSHVSTGNFPLMRVDPQQMRSALSQMLDNLVRSTAEAAEITVSTALRDETALIVIRNNKLTGDRLGLEATPQTPTNAVQNGWLALLRRVVERHAGTLEIVGTAEGGTLIRILLPVNRNQTIRS